MIANLPLAAVLPAVILSLLSVVALVFCDFRQIRPGRYLFKPLAAAAFVWLALSLGATESSYGQWLLAGLCCCLVGDLFLMPDSERSFLIGLTAFLIGHLLYAVAFLQLPANVPALLLGSVPALVLLVGSSRALAPHLPQDMKIAVPLYSLVITAMLLCAFLTAGQPGGLVIILGAVGFALSDLAVSRQQFVVQTPLNALWGTPLYFLSQMLLALSVGLIL